MRVAYVFLEAMFPFLAWKSFKMSSEDVFFIICLLFFFACPNRKKCGGRDGGSPSFQPRRGPAKAPEVVQFFVFSKQTTLRSFSR